LQIKWVNLTKLRGVHSSGIWCCFTGYRVPDTSGWEEFFSDIATDEFQFTVFPVNVRIGSPISMASYPSRTESYTTMYVLMLHVFLSTGTQIYSFKNSLYTFAAILWWLKHTYIKYNENLNQIKQIF